MREFYFNENFFEIGDTVQKTDGKSFEVVDIDTLASYGVDGLKISKNIKLREQVEFTEIKLDVDIKS